MTTILILALYIISFATTTLSPWLIILLIWIFDALRRIKTNKIFLLMMLRRQGRIFGLGILLFFHLVCGWILYGIVQLFK